MITQFADVAARGYLTCEVAVLLKTEIAPVLSQAAMALSNRNKHGDALLLWERIAKIEEGCGDLIAVAAARSDLAATYFRLGQYETSIRILRDEVLPLRQQIDDGPGQAKCRHELCLSYAQMRDGVSASQELLASIQSACAAGATNLVILGIQTAGVIRRMGLQFPSEVIEKLRAAARSAVIPELEAVLEEAFGPAALRTDPFRRLRVFISYGSEDRDYAKLVYEVLDSAFLDVFLDQRRLYPGWKRESVLHKHLELADVLVVIVGNDTFAKPHVRLEVETYLDCKLDVPFDQFPDRRPVIPILIPGCQALPKPFDGWQWLDFREGPLVRHLPLLHRAIWDAWTPVPTAEEPFMEEGRRSSPAPEKEENPIAKLAKTEGIPVSPRIVASQVNLGIAEHNIPCWQVKLNPDVLLFGRCGEVSKLLCVGCGRGACSEAAHTAELFWHAPFPDTRKGAP